MSEDIPNLYLASLDYEIRELKKQWDSTSNPVKRVAIGMRLAAKASEKSKAARALGQ